MHTQKKKTEDNHILKDGEFLSVRIMLMDSARTHSPMFSDPMTGHRPGYVSISDAERQRRVQQQAAINAALEQRWRTPDFTAKPAATPQPTGDARSRAYAAREQWLTNAWRHR